MLDGEAIDRITRRAVKEIISLEEFVRLLRLGRPLRLKMGFDPSRPDIHLGHVVGLRKLRQLQELGHQVVLIVGDWTAQIGDPSGQSATRPMLTHQEVKENADSYLRQFFKVVDRDRTEVKWQSEWFGNFTLADVIRLTGRFTVAQFLERDDFAQRFREHRPIALTELLYPLLQAYDSVAIQADVEFGGSDQKFNLLVGRELQGMMGQTPQQCFLMPILVGTDGVQKMSKSLGNYVAVEDPPDEMFGKLMSLPDEQIVPYFDYLTDTSDAELADLQRDLTGPDKVGVNPMHLKKNLAREITGQFHGRAEADAAQGHFERVVQQRQQPSDMLTVLIRREGDSYVLQIPQTLVDLRVHARQVEEALGVSTTSTTFVTVVLRAPQGQADAAEALAALGLASSKSQAKRLLTQGSVEVDGQKVKETIPIRDGSVIRVGKRRWLRLVQVSR